VAVISGFDEANAETAASITSVEPTPNRTCSGLRSSLRAIASLNFPNSSKWYLAVADMPSTIALIAEGGGPSGFSLESSHTTSPWLEGALWGLARDALLES